MSNQTKSAKPILILDANAFISCTRLIQFGKAYRLITTSSVLDELKDQKTKQYLQKLPYKIQQKYHDDKLLNFVKQFAKKTGDIGSLSDVDMELIALVCTIYKEQGFANKLRKQPVPIVQKVVEEEDNQQQDQDQDQDYEEQEQTQQQQQKNNQKNNQDQQEWITVPNTKKKQQEQNDSDLSDQQGWITPNNYHKKMAQISTAYLQKKQQQPKKQQQTKQQQQNQQQQQTKQSQQQFQICLISADFAIQNVATQMGIKLLSLDGRVISSIRRFIWECYLCWKQHKVTQNKVKLCSGCGYNSLSKIAYSLDMNGNAILHRKKGWKPNTTIQEWKQKKYQEQQKRKKHQHQRRTKKASIFDTVG